MLSKQQLEKFITAGYVRLDQAFPRDLADKCREILWKDTGCDPHDRSTWKQPVVWLWAYGQEPFVKAANTPMLLSAYDQLVGKGRWKPMNSLGTFPIRFPTHEDTGDTGWHIDASFPGEGSDPNDFLSWRVNVNSRGRAMLTLFLFSDVGENEAPTRIRVGSHLEISRILEPLGEDGVSISSLDVSSTAKFPEVLATGEAGTVYLCHPFLVHAAQRNRGTEPRFMAQPPLYSTEPFELHRDGPTAYTPVEIAIRRALEGTA
jgi:Phytanoyl-CoA dioxygenase (PhyH)